MNQLSKSRESLKHLAKSVELSLDVQTKLEQASSLSNEKIRMNDTVYMQSNASSRNTFFSGAGCNFESTSCFRETGEYVKLLYATSNSFKISSMRRRLKNLPIELITPEELGIQVDIIEDGNTVVENAIKKARGYYAKTKLPTIAGDSSLYIEGLPQNQQPGLFVRRFFGKELSDDELVYHYAKLLDSIGGSSSAYYITGLALIIDQEIYTFEARESSFILTSKLSDKDSTGDPLAVMSIDPKSGHYFNEMNDEEFERRGLSFDEGCRQFICSHLDFFEEEIDTSEAHCYRKQYK